MTDFGLNEHHNAEIVNFMRFSRYQRLQCLKDVKATMQNMKNSKLLDDTYTIDEVKDFIDEVQDAIHSDVENELLNTSHTNVLLLQQLFSQAEKWHLELQTDLSELENRELLDKVKVFEEEMSSFKGDILKPASPRKRLAPLCDNGPVALLNAEISKLNQENQTLRERMKLVEVQATDLLKDKSEVRNELESTKQQLISAQSEPKGDNEEHLEKLTEMVGEVTSKLEEERSKGKEEQQKLEKDLTSTKHTLLDVQHQLQMAEKELEKKFSQTGAYKNLKTMLSTKNEQIKVLRQRLKKYEQDESTDEE